MQSYDIVALCVWFVSLSTVFVLLFFLSLLIYFERVREQEQGRDRERDSQAGSGAQTRELGDHDPSGNQEPQTD